MVAIFVVMDKGTIYLVNICYTNICTTITIVVHKTEFMIKRVFLVLTLLFAQSVFAQQVSVNQNALSPISIEKGPPVVTVTSATGSIIISEIVGSTTALQLPPAEAATSSASTSTSSLIVTEFGAFGTSSTSTVSTTTEIEEGTSTTLKNDEQRLFSLVYAGFEKFVERYFGWD